MNVEFTVINEGGKGTKAQISLYDDPKWADPYDVIIHNECFADTVDSDYIRKITKAHESGKPALVIHCAMHTYRSAKIDDWRRFLGVTSKRHEHKAQYPALQLVKYLRQHFKIMDAQWSLVTSPLLEKEQYKPSCPSNNTCLLFSLKIPKKEQEH